MDFTTLKNSVFQNYYFNSYLPGTLGSYDSSIIFNYLLALESIQENLIDEINISKKWITDEPTWYTSSLSKLFFIPKFLNETDKEYLDKLFLLTDMSQDKNSIITAVYSITKKAINLKTNIQIVNKLDGVSASYEDKTSLVSPEYWDGTSVWSSETNIQRTLFAVSISFSNRGSNLDITTWDYWILPENYTKIEDMVKLYKPPGSTFELRLNIPVDVNSSITIFSNSLIKSEQMIQILSDTTIV